jgi:hypothetical protein
MRLTCLPADHGDKIYDIDSVTIDLMHWPPVAERLRELKAPEARIQLSPGRPKGSKHKLSEEFVAGLCEGFKQHGSAVIEKVRKEQPADYLRVIASVIPKELTVNSNPYEDMSDEALLESLERVGSRAAALIARGVAPGAGDELKRREEVTRLEENLTDFVRGAWPNIDTAQYQQTWAIDALCDHLTAVTEGQIKRLLINFPPGAERRRLRPPAGQLGPGRAARGPTIVAPRCSSSAAPIARTSCSRFRTRRAASF